ncbi:TadE/TadG family type IV pilus assembly protein [Pirellulaceae bacterium SH467]|jgi:Flp pilus assembly protein TadG
MTISNYRSHPSSRYRVATKNRRGAFTVEFAFCAGIFFMILMAGVEFSRFMFARHSVDQAAYEGARAGIIPGATSSDVRQVATRILNATGIRKATIQVTPETINDNTAEVEVHIRCNYADSSWMGPLFLGAAVIETRLTLDHENKAYLVKERAPGIGDNDHEPIDI